MFQYPGHHRAATGDSEADKWRRVSPDQSPGPGMIDSGSTGDLSSRSAWGLYYNHPGNPPTTFSSGANLHQGLDFRKPLWS